MKNLKSKTPTGSSSTGSIVVVTVALFVLAITWNKVNDSNVLRDKAAKDKAAVEAMAQGKDLSEPNSGDTVSVQTVPAKAEWPQFPSEVGTEVQKKIYALERQHPSSELTKLLSDRKWDEAVAGLKTLITGIHALPHKKDDPFTAEVARKVEAHDAKRIGSGPGVVWEATCRTGPYTLYSIQVAEYRDLIVVTSKGTYEYGKTDTTPGADNNWLNISIVEIALTKVDGKLRALYAEYNSVNQRTLTPESDAESLDVTEAVKSISIAIRLIEEHYKDQSQPK
jgi:hypothetical protein